MNERPDGRKPGDLRRVTLTPGLLRHAEGSCLIHMGETQILTAATVTEGVPGWRRGTGEGWLTAEYNMLPRSGMERVARTSQRGGRSQEIQRLIGRALRAAVDLRAMGENTITIDCDVIEADGGTRTAAVTGAMVSLWMASRYMLSRGLTRTDPIRTMVAAISVGLVDTEPRLDLCYQEDVRADVDMNVVMTEEGSFVELQGTAEGVPFTRQEMTALTGLASRGVKRLITRQRKTIAGLEAKG